MCSGHVNTYLMVLGAYDKAYWREGAQPKKRHNAFPNFNGKGPPEAGMGPGAEKIGAAGRIVRVGKGLKEYPNLVSLHEFTICKFERCHHNTFDERDPCFRRISG